MELKNLERVQDLQGDLERWDKIIAAFERAPGPTVPTYASVHESFHRCVVELLPVEKSVAVSAAQRGRSKVVAQLQALGVTVD